MRRIKNFLTGAYNRAKMVTLRDVKDAVLDTGYFLGLMFFFFFGQALIGNIALDAIDNPEPKSAVIKILVSTPDKQLVQICSGTVVSPNNVLTAAHCIDPKELREKYNTAYFIKDEKNTTIRQVEVYKVDYNDDIAVLKGDFTGFEAARVVDTGVDMKKPAQACGYPRGSFKMVCHPFTYEGQGVIGPSFKVIGKGQSYPGMSGGPVLSDDMRTIYAVGFGLLQDEGARWITTVSPLVNSQGIYGYISSPAKLIKRDWTPFPIYDMIAGLGIYIYLLLKALGIL